MKSPIGNYMYIPRLFCPVAGTLRSKSVLLLGPRRTGKTLYIKNQLKPDRVYNLLLNRFALERLLLRVSTSAHAKRFLLKGALLFTLWHNDPRRPTRDADLLGFGPIEEANLSHVRRRCSQARSTCDLAIARDLISR